VVSHDLDWVLHAFKVMSPLLYTLDNRKHLSIMNLIVVLNQVECLRQECDWVPCIVVMQLLGEHCAVVIPEPSASSQNGRLLSGSTKTGADVTSSLSFVKESS
jgi:hypothetical protein